MKSQNRIQPYDKTEHAAPSQERILAIGIQDALSCLQREGQAAVALCKMNADVIQRMVKDGVNGMQNFEGSGFEQGGFELAFDLVSNFDSSFGKWEADQLGLIRGEKHSVEAWIKIGSAIISLFHVLRLQGEIMTEYHSDVSHDSGAMECSAAIIDRLNSAWHASYTASTKFQQSVSAGLAA